MGFEYCLHKYNTFPPAFLFGSQGDKNGIFKNLSFSDLKATRKAYVKLTTQATSIKIKDHSFAYIAVSPKELNQERFNSIITSELVIFIETKSVWMIYQIS